MASVASIATTRFDSPEEMQLRMDSEATSGPGTVIATCAVLFSSAAKTAMAMCVIQRASERRRMIGPLGGTDGAARCAVLLLTGGATMSAAQAVATNLGT